VRGAAGVVTVALALAGAALAGLPATARAADRPSEEDMFGSAPATPAPAAKSAVPKSAVPGPPPTGGQSPDGGTPAGDGGASLGEGGAPAASPPAGPVSLQPPPSSPAEAGGQPASRDESLLGDPNAGPKLSGETAPDDPLKIGGQIYFRALAQATQGQVPGDARLSAPALVDGYFDARPNDRVRGFVLGRLLFDPTLPSMAMAATNGTNGTMNGTGETVATPTVPLLSGTQATRGPSAVLDQLWLRFDIKRTVFVTAGRQHVKWGTARFWTPTDFLHPLRRNPVAAFDARPGFTMVKLHLPWEERGWNFYGFGLVEGVNAFDRATGRPIDGSDKLPTVGQVGGALRAEVVVGTSEWGLGGVFYRHQKPRFGGDVSFGIGDFDLYADAGFRYGSEIPRRGYNTADVPFTLPGSGGTVTVALNDWVDQKYPLYYSVGIKPQVTAGGTYSLRYNDNDVFTVTGEYFYNSRGYDDPHVYPGLFLTNTFEFFYTGKHYAALGAIAAAPWSWNYTTFSLTTLGNLSDQSFITRLDYSLTMLTHLRFEAFGAVNYGRRTGEFRLGVDGFMLPGGSTFSLQPQAFSVGLGLRISI